MSEETEGGDRDGPSARGPEVDADFIRRGAEQMTEDDVRRLAERENELRERFDKPGPIGKIRSDLNLLVSLVGEYSRGSYREVPWWAVAAVSFGLLYVLNPADLLPDVLPVVGQLDDLAVLTVCLLLVEQELQTYKQWKFDNVEDPAP